jgi:molecular chaperone GrpE
MERVEDTNTAAMEPDAERERLKADLRKEQDMHVRALADFDNYRRRVERDRAKTAASGKRDIILSLLEVLDGFDRALPYMSDAPPSVAEGVQAIHRRLLNLLDAQQVTPLKTVGEPFDPAVHEAIGALQSDDHPPGTVTDEVQRGYRLGDELLRPARVRVER